MKEATDILLTNHWLVWNEHSKLRADGQQKVLSNYYKAQMSYYVDCDDVALRHMAKLLKEQSHEQNEHAEMFLTYQHKRDGCIVLQDIRKPERDEWGNSLEALQCALQLENAVNEALVDLHKLPTEKNDPCEYVQD
ncbi:ferritin heavy chain B-like [Terrapene carolina triunguis]|uniref:ferritin heavy chain B-like n=1 Tax=Terrapene triunguis TaxID=2587831 RepID=UPI000E77C60F|nr:ferritin heavy chain B-like [Terrapene carolina triunguis]